MSDLVILGAGPAGLVAAADAARRGLDVQVLDRAHAVGGMASSFVIDGIRVDHGSHRLHPAAPPEVLGRLRRLLGNELQERPRNGRLRLEGRWLTFPLRATELLTATPPAFAVRAGLDAVLSPIRRPREDTYAEVVRAGLGSTVVERFHLPYARKLWGVEPGELDGSLARRRISAAGPVEVLRRLATTRGGRQPTFLYPRGGFGRIVERLADDAVDAGAEVVLGVEITGVRAGAVETVGQGELASGQVWSTIPPSALARLAGAPPDVVASASSIRFRGLVLVYLVVPRPRWTPFDAHYIADDRNPVARVSEPKNYRDGDDPADRTVLCVEVPASVGDSVWSSAPDDLGELARECLVREELPDPRHVAVEVRRLPAVYPVLTPSTLDALDDVAAWEAAEDRVVSFGRPALAVPDNTHHVMAMGAAAARCLRDDATFDRSAWASALADFRTNVVED